MRARLGHLTTIQIPHEGRVRSRYDQTPVEPPEPPCTHWHPAYGADVNCGRPAHPYGIHLHYSAKYGTITWT